MWNAVSPGQLSCYGNICYNYGNKGHFRSLCREAQDLEGNSGTAENDTKPTLTDITAHAGDHTAKSQNHNLPQAAGGEALHLTSEMAYRLMPLKCHKDFMKTLYLFIPPPLTQMMSIL